MDTNSEIRARQYNFLSHISPEVQDELVRRGLLQCDETRWRFGDDNNGTTRRVDDPKWKRADTKGSDWHRLIGLQDVVRHDRKHVLLALEGSKDALAAAEIAFRLGVLPETGILCALGSGYRPIKSEIGQLQDRHVVVIGDNDAAGMETAKIVSSALTVAGVEHEVWDWSACPLECKDLYAYLVEMDRAGRQFSPLCTLSKCTFFSSPLPSHDSTVQPFNRSTQQTISAETGIGDDEKLGIVCPFIVKAKGTGNRMSFLLARSISHRKFSMTEIESIFHIWFERSRPLLPPDADEGKALQTFYNQLKRVRFTDAGLKSACERAQKATPPFIPARDGDELVAKLAALCRELQREAGERPFICPVNVVQQFLDLRWANQANYLLHVLEDEKVIECVERGAPNKPGQKGKPTLWRYKLANGGSE